MEKVNWGGFVAIMLAVILIGNWLGERSASTSAQTPSTTATSTSIEPTAPLQVLASTQTADGVTEAELSPALAERIGQFNANGIKLRIDSLAQQAGRAQPPAVISPSATVLEVQGKKLIVIHYQFNVPTRAVDVISIRGNDLHRVMCVRDSDQPISLTTGPCASKILDVHGVVLQAAAR